jgi:hypothetical protein
LARAAAALAAAMVATLVAKVGRVTTSGQLNEFALPTADAQSGPIVGKVEIDR